MLYAETKDGHYLKQARKMAELFIAHFTGNRNGHWSGHLMSWRGVLFLYEVTGERRYLDLCQARWAIQIQRFRFARRRHRRRRRRHFHDTCFHEDWLRWNLELWRLTGNVRYLDAVERLVHNSYGEQQAATGGFGGYAGRERSASASSDGVIRDSVLDRPSAAITWDPADWCTTRRFWRPEMIAASTSISSTTSPPASRRPAAIGGSPTRNMQDLRRGGMDNGSAIVFGR